MQRVVISEFNLLQYLHMHIKSHELSTVKNHLILAHPKKHLRTFRIATQADGHVRAVQVLPAAEHADRQEAGGGGGLLRIGRLSGRPPAGKNHLLSLLTDETTFFLFIGCDLYWNICFMT